MPTTDILSGTGRPARRSAQSAPSGQFVVLREHRGRQYRPREQLRHRGRAAFDPVVTGDSEVRIDREPSGSQGQVVAPTTLLGGGEAEARVVRYAGDEADLLVSLVQEMVDRGSGRGDLVDAYGGRARHVGTHTDER